MTSARLKKLKQIGFVWSTRTNPEHWSRLSYTLHRGAWEKMLKRLKDYKERTGHVLVPKEYKEDPQLSRWVRRQRKLYRDKQDGKFVMLTAEREKALNDIGFVWDTKPMNLRYVATMERFDIRRKKMMKNLMRFRATYGHCWGKSGCCPGAFHPWVQPFFWLSLCVLVCVFTSLPISLTRIHTYTPHLFNWNVVLSDISFIFRSSSTLQYPRDTTRSLAWRASRIGSDRCTATERPVMTTSSPMNV